MPSIRYYLSKHTKYRQFQTNFNLFWFFLLNVIHYFLTIAPIWKYSANCINNTWLHFCICYSHFNSTLSEQQFPQFLKLFLLLLLFSKIMSIHLRVVQARLIRLLKAHHQPCNQHSFMIAAFIVKVHPQLHKNSCFESKIASLSLSFVLVWVQRCVSCLYMSDLTQCQFAVFQGWCKYNDFHFLFPSIIKPYVIVHISQRIQIVCFLCL